MLVELGDRQTEFIDYAVVERLRVVLGAPPLGRLVVPLVPKAALRPTSRVAGLCLQASVAWRLIVSKRQLGDV